MKLDDAPVADDEDPSCTNCKNGTYVIYDGDRVCNQCGHLSGTGDGDVRTYRERHLTDEWRNWERERDDYDGFRGPDRVKFVGSFARAYDFGPDFGIGEHELL